MPVENVEYKGPEVGVVYGAKSRNLRTGDRRGIGDFPRNKLRIADAIESASSLGGQDRQWAQEISRKRVAALNDPGNELQR